MMRIEIVNHLPDDGKRENKEKGESE